MPKINYIFILLVALFIAVRITVLFFGTANIYNDDDLYVGAVALELIKGLPLSLFDYQKTVYSGGEAAMFLFVVPLFIIFGPSYFSLKLVALLFPIGTLVFLFLFMDKFFSRRLAVLTLLLYIFSPPIFSRYNLIPIGTQLESSFFSIVAVYIFYKIFFEERQKTYDNESPMLYFMSFGLICGVGSWFCYAFFIILLALLIFWFLFDRKFFLKKAFLFFLLFFTIGFSLWIYVNFMKWNFAGIDKIRELFYPLPGDRIGLFYRAEKLINLFIYIIPHSMKFNDVGGVRKELFSYTYYFILVFSLIGLIWYNAKAALGYCLRLLSLKDKKSYPGYIPKESFFIFYILLFLLIFSFTNSDIDITNFRYLVALYPIFFIIIALFLSKLWEGSILKKYLSAFIIIILLSIGIIGNTSLISPHDFKRVGQYRGYQYFALANPIFRKFGYDVKNCMGVIDKVGKENKRTIYRALAEEVASKLSRGEIEKWLAYISKIDQTYHPYFYEELGKEMDVVFGNDLEKTVNFLNSLDEEYRIYLYRGLNCLVADIFNNDIEKCIKFIHTLDIEYDTYMPHLRYIVIRNKIPQTGFFLMDHISQFVAFAEMSPDVQRKYIYKELGKTIGNEFLKELAENLRGIDIRNITMIISIVPEMERRYVYEGFGEGMVINKIEDIALWLDIIDQIELRYKNYVYRGFFKGLAWIYGKF